MDYLKRCFGLSLINNHVTVDSNNTPSYESECSTILIEPCLVLTQYVDLTEDSLVYCVYIINNLKCDLYNIKLRDILPKGVKFVDTFVENGHYENLKNQILYNIDIIKPHSYCKIILRLHPIALGQKINSIEVISSESTVHNPCKVCIII